MKPRLQTSRRINRIIIGVRAMLLAPLIVVAHPTRLPAATALWTGESSGADTWTAPSNWLANYRPMNGDDVVFGPSTRTTSFDNMSFLTISTLQFSANAPAFTLHVSRGVSLTVSGGVTNNSANIQTLINDNNLGDGPEIGGTTIFQNDATADDLRITNRGGIYWVDGWGETVFEDSSNAGAAVITNADQSGTGWGGRTFFRENSNAGSANITNSAGVTSANSFGRSFTEFVHNASAANATITNNAGDFSGATRFYGDVTAANATITNQGAAASGDEGGSSSFLGASAGNATIINGGGAAENAAGGLTEFTTGATAATAMIINNPAATAGAASGGVEFYHDSTAADATISNYGAATLNSFGGRAQFSDVSTAGNATLIAQGGSNGGAGGTIAFYADSTAGTARIEAFGNGFLDISGRNAPGVTVGSLNGDGLVFLGANQLTVGNDNTSATFSGTIQDGGASAGPNASSMGSLKKIGIGTFTLDHANSYSCGTFLNAGTLRASRDGALGRGSVNTVAGTTLILQGGVTNNYIWDTAVLSIGTTSTLNLVFAGTPDVVGFLLIDGVSQPAGLYGSAASGAPNQLPQFSGTGKILVTTPAARSRKQHGNGGNAHITLPFTGPVGIECRNAGENNSYTIIVTFGFPVTFANASVTSGTGMVDSTTGNGTDFITLNVTGVTNVQRLAITLSGVNYGAATGEVVVRMGVLIGDTTGNGTVNASDVSETKSKSGQTVDTSNFRNDVTVSNSINSSDVSLVKSKSGTALP